MKPQLCFFFKKPLVPLTDRLYKTYFARQEIVFECLLLSELFHNDPEFILDIFRGIFSCGFIILQWENIVIPAVW